MLRRVVAGQPPGQPGRRARRGSSGRYVLEVAVVAVPPRGAVDAGREHVGERPQLVDRPRDDDDVGLRQRIRRLGLALQRARRPARRPDGHAMPRSARGRTSAARPKRRGPRSSTVVPCSMMSRCEVAADGAALRRPRRDLVRHQRHGGNPCRCATPAVRVRQSGRHAPRDEQRWSAWGSGRCASGSTSTRGRTLELRGCVNDAKAWADAAHRALRLRPRRRHGDHRRQGHQGQRPRRPRRTCSPAPRAGDVLVFTNSSHGTYVADTDGDESLYDEAICPYDCDDRPDRRRRAARAVRAASRRGVRLTVISDSCHSGSVHPGAGDLDAPRPPAQALRRPERARPARARRRPASRPAPGASASAGVAA